MPTTDPENTPLQGLAADFVARVTRRDFVDPPLPPSQTPEAIAARVNAWLLARHRLRDQRTRHALGAMLLVLMRQSEASTAALQAAADLGPRSGARSTLRLAALGLTEWFYRARTRCHRLTRAGEDALLPVVTGLDGPS